MQKIRKTFVARMLVIVLVAGIVGMQGITAFAASVTSFSDNLSRLKENTNANHEIKFVTPSGVAAAGTINLTFAGFSLATVDAIVFGDVDFATAATCGGAFTDKTLAAAAAGATWGVSNPSTGVIRLTSATDTVTATNCIRIRIGTNAVVGTTGTNQIQNGGNATAHTVSISGTFGDSGAASIDIVIDDQVVITAVVDPSITFSIDQNAIEFGTLSASSAKFADLSQGNGTEVEAHKLSAGTNATSGYIMYVSGATLTGGANSIDAIGASNTASATGTEQFGVRFVASGAGSGTVSAPYAAAGFAYDGVAAPSPIASAGGSTANNDYSARYLANIRANTEAGAYATTLTYTVTAGF